MSGTPAFEADAFQTGKKGSSDTPAFQGALSAFTLDVGNGSVVGGQFSKGRWRTFVGGIEAEARAKLEAKRFAAETKKRALSTRNFGLSAKVSQGNRPKHVAQDSRVGSGIDHNTPFLGIGDWHRK